MSSWCGKYFGLVIMLIATFGTKAQVITTIAGTGVAGHSGDNMPALECRISSPGGIAVDTAGNIFFADELNNAVRKIDRAGIITTVAGIGVAGYSGDLGAASSAMLNRPTSLALDGKGNLYISDTYNEVVRKVDTAGKISLVAGAPELWGYWGDYGPASTGSLMNKPKGLVFDTEGNLYIADSWNNGIRKLDTAGIISRFAGCLYGASEGFGDFWGDGDKAFAAAFFYPSALLLDKDGSMLIADERNNRIRKINKKDSIVTTIAGGGATLPGDNGPATDAALSTPSGIALDAAGNLFIADQDNYCIRMVNKAGTITRVAGNYINGFGGDGGPAVDAHLRTPTAVAVDNAGNLLLADNGNNRIRKVSMSATAVAQTNAQGYKLSISPNPNSGAFRLAGLWSTHANQTVVVAITDVLGRTVYSDHIAPQNGIIDQPIKLNSIANGLYLLHLKSADGSAVIKFTVEQ